MAAIGGLSGGTSNSVNMYGASMKGYGGIASGMDTDSMIEGMTQGTRTKIQELLKKKELYQWQTDAYRSVSDQLVSFSKKYLDIAKSDSPYRSSFFDKTLATAGGSNSGKVSVTGPGSLLDRMKILGVTALAKDANLVTKKDSAARDFSTGTVDFDNDLVESNLEGGYMRLKYGNQVFTIPMVSGASLGEGADAFKADYTTPENIKKSITAQLKACKISDTETLADKVQIDYTGNKFSLKATADPVAGDGSDELSIIGGTQDHLKILGFLDDDNKFFSDGKITTAGYNGNKEVTNAELQKITPFEKRMADKTMSFSFNGISKTIKLPSEEEWVKIKNGSYTDKDGTTIADPTEALADFMQQKLDTAFGKNKVEVKGDAVTGLTFSGAKKEVTNSDGSKSYVEIDPSAVFKMTDADAGVLGEDNLFNMEYNAGNRLNFGSELEKSGLAGLSGDDWHAADGKLYLEINGVEITGLTDKSTMNDIVNAINQSDAGVKVNYLETADKFTLTSTRKGETGNISFNMGSKDGVNNFASKLFGAKFDVDGKPILGPDGKQAGDYTYTAGNDAEMVVQYEGGVEVTVKRDSNSFSLDGTTFTLNGKFMSIKDPSTDVYEDAITFSTSVDVDKVTKTIKSMVEDYNKIVETVQNLVGKKPDRDYGPLTEDEKSQLSESQIEKLENKAKEGILFNDPLLRSLSDQMRTVFSGTANIGVLKEMGMTVGSSYKDGGKIEFDETTFKAALQADPDKVKTLFTKAATEDDAGGFTAKLKGITDSFAKWEGSAKGLLIEKAGSTYSPNSLLKNSLKTLMDEIDTDVKALKKKLQTEIDRYTRQFSSLEQLVAQMNSQSNQLAQMMGG